jgi:hypothetical protein
MPIGSGKYYLDRSYAATFNVQRFTSGDITVTYGKQNIEMNGRGGAANAPTENFAGFDPGNFAGNNPPVFTPGNFAANNPPTFSPGNPAFNAPVNGVNVTEFTQIFSNEIGFNSFSAELGFQTNPCPSPTTNSFGTEFIEVNYSCPPATQPGTFSGNNPPTGEPGNPTFNSPTFDPGNPTFNSPTPFFAYVIGNPGNPTNVPIPGYPTRVFPGANPNNTGFSAQAASAVYVKLGQEESRPLEGRANPVTVGTGSGTSNNTTFRGYITIAYNAT